MSRKKTKSRIRKWSENIVKKVIKTPFSMMFNTSKDIVSKTNPFDKKIDKNDISDTGAESMRLAYTSVKQGKNTIKTVNKSIKTTKRTIKTTGNVVKTTGTVIYRTTAFAVKSTVVVSKFTVNAVIHVVASLMNPIVIFLGSIIIVFVIMALLVMMLLGGGISASNSTKKAYSSAAGLVKVNEQYQNATEYFNIAIQNRQDAFNTLIDSLYYDYDDLTHSDLVYMESTDISENKTTYETSFATDERKNTLKSAWNFSDSVREIIAIAYVYLEKQENAAHSTKDGIYKVTYTQEVFDMIAEKCIHFTDTIYSGQKCPDENCTKHIETHPNPEYNEAVSATDKFWNAYDEWTGIANLIAENDGVNDDVQWRIDNWISVYDMSPYYSNYGWDFADDLYNWYLDSWNYMIKIPEEIEEITYICEYQHNLHSVGLWCYDKENIMNALDFTDNEKEWVRLTELGFENNQNIS